MLFLKEKKHTRLQIACGDISNIRLENENLIITTDEKYIMNILENPDNIKIIEEALSWQGVQAKIVVKRVLKLAELQEADLGKLKALGLDVKIIKGE